MKNEAEKPVLESASRAGRAMMNRLGLPLALSGAALTVAAAITNPGAAGFAYLAGFVFLWSVVMGALFFLAMHHLTRAVWSVAARRVMETIVSPLPIVGLLFLPVLFQAKELYEWMRPEAVAGDALLQAKSAYLNFPFFTVRAIIYFAVWIGFGLFFTRTSLRQDKEIGGIEPVKKMRRASAPFSVLFAFTITFAAFDWLMSLEPRWFSTIFGVYVFSGSSVAGLAAIILLVLWLRRRGLLADAQGRPLVGDAHLYHLGTLLFAFSCFWGYIAMSQMLLIWYANLPEETFWFAERWRGGWIAVSLLLMLLRFVLPFLLLLSRVAKTNVTMLTVMATLALFGQLVDVVWLVFPAAGPGFGWTWLSLGPLLLMAGIFFAATGRFLTRHAVVAAGDPLLEESRRYRL